MKKGNKTYRVRVCTPNLSGYLRWVRNTLLDRGLDGLPEPSVYEFSGLTEDQFCALEDVAAWMHLNFEGEREGGR